MTKSKQPPMYKTFSGKRYMLNKIFRDREAADRNAKQLRRREFAARVSKAQDSCNVAVYITWVRSK